MTKYVSISDVVFDSSIYPRAKPSSTIISEYADSLLAGDKFPPIALEASTGRLLDGYHRWKAHKQLVENPTLEDNEVDYGQIAVEYHDIPDGIPAKLFCARMSSRHGHRLTTGEIKSLSREICEANPNFSDATIAEYVGRSQRTVNDYVRDIKARKDEHDRSILLRLSMLGWTQQEIGDAIGVTKQSAGQKSKEMAELPKLAKNILDTGIPHMDVAERFNLPLQLVWAIDLDGRTDAERMERLGIKIQPYDVWQFSKCHDLFGSQHPGRIPGELIAHILYFFTEQGDIIVDPMSGSGTTQDVCLALGRKCYGYDIDDRHDRADTLTHNIATDGWPERIKKADLLFWDPPYFEKMDSSTIGPDGYIEGSISKLERNEYLAFFQERLTEARGAVKDGTRLAFLMSDWDDNTNEREGIFVWDYADILRDAGWNLIRHIQAPLSTQQVHPDIVNKFRVSRRLARLERYLFIGEAK